MTIDRQGALFPTVNTQQSTVNSITAPSCARIMLLASIPVRAPFPWRRLLEYLSFRLIPEIERVEDGRYVRRTEQGIVTVAFDVFSSQIVTSVDRPVDEATVLERVARLFDARFQSSGVDDFLGRSPILAPLIAKAPGMRPLGAWSPFELCVRTILGQQVTVAAANTLMGRWVQRCGAISPDCILAADLTNIGMPGRRVESIRALALAVQEQRVRFERPWSDVDESLGALPGFGPWTRAYLAIRLGREADAFPATDLGLIRAANADSPAQLLKLADAWRPYRAYAATYLWAVPP